MTAQRRIDPMTIEAFDTFVEAQADTALFELVEGVIVMMTNRPRCTSRSLRISAHH